MENKLADEELPYIPKTFSIGGHTFKVLLYEELYDEDGASLYGQFDYEDLAIRIRIYKDNGQLLPREIIYNSYWHELMHAFNYLWNTGTDESLASTFAMLMCEYINTKNYALKENNSASYSSRKET